MLVEALRGIEGRMLGEDEYIDDFWPRFQRAVGVCWKLERRQEFSSPDVPSWVAMVEGDWERSLEIMHGSMRKAIDDDFAQFPNLERRRLRIVAAPPTPYLQWEMNVLRLRVEAGERIRVLDVGEVRESEEHGPLPELVTLGADAVYEVLYSDAGLNYGARLIEDLGVVEGCMKEIEALFDRGEGFASYFEREIAHLPPPAVEPPSGRG
jgi:hypothetical protein